jgi:hypothetical protein
LRNLSADLIFCPSLSYVSESLKRLPLFLKV